MYVDRSGNFAISITALLIGMAIGAGVGACIETGVSLYQDYQDDESINGSIGWQRYVGNIVGGAIAGAGTGFAVVLGAAIGTASVVGTAATLGKITLTVGNALALGAGVSFASGAVGYTTKTLIQNPKDFNVGTMLIEGGFYALSGVLSVFGGAIGGLTGFRGDLISKLFYKKFDIVLRMFIENIFTVGGKIGLSLIKNLIIG